MATRMHCVPARTKELKILLWQCRSKKPGSSSERLSLPSMAGFLSSPNRSKRYRAETCGPQHAHNSSAHHAHNSSAQYAHNSRVLQMQPAAGRRGGVSFDPDQTRTSIREHVTMLSQDQHSFSVDTKLTDMLSWRQTAVTRGQQTSSRRMLWLETTSYTELNMSRGGGGGDRPVGQESGVVETGREGVRVSTGDVGGSRSRIQLQMTACVPADVRVSMDM